MTTVQKFALVYGIVFVIGGIGGFIPGVTVFPHQHPDVRLTAGMGLLLGLFPINVLHNIVHLLFGAWGLFAARTAAASLMYARSVAVIYVVLGVMGLLRTMNLHTMFGLAPLYGHDVWLHFVLAAGAAYFGFVHRSRRPYAT